VRCRGGCAHGAGASGAVASASSEPPWTLAALDAVEGQKPAKRNYAVIKAELAFPGACPAAPVCWAIWPIAIRHLCALPRFDSRQPRWCKLFSTPGQRSLSPSIYDVFAGPLPETVGWISAKATHPDTPLILIYPAVRGCWKRMANAPGVVDFIS